MFRLPYSFDPRVAPTVAPQGTRRLGLIHHAEPGLLPSQAVASLFDRTGQLSKRDFHPLDCSLVGCSNRQSRYDMDVAEETLGGQVTREVQPLEIVPGEPSLGTNPNREKNVI